MNLSFLIFCLFAMTATTPPTYGNAEKKLPVCHKTPNCVSSQADSLDKQHYIEPFKIKGDAHKAWETLKKILESQDRLVITHETHDSLHAQATSLMFHFVDDLDALFYERDGLIHIRSASRVGHHDFGVNRKRVEKLRKKLREAGVIE